MKQFAILLLLSIGACSKQAAPADQRAIKPGAVTTSAGQSMLSAKPAAMHFMAVPKDKAQLDRLLAMGYTVHNDHMHPPGVKECPLDKAAGSVVQ